MNATKIVSGGSAGGVLAAVVVYVLSRVHVGITTEDASVISLGIVALAAFVTHNGVVGVGRLIWRGGSKPASAPTDATPPSAG